jgi:hypothetical protein
MTSSTIKVRNIPKAVGVFFELVLCSKPVFLGYQILALTVLLIASALESNNYIGRVAMYWIIGIPMLFSYIWLALAPWVSNQIRLASMLILTIMLFQWW